jgi:hypothetical protein
MLTTTTRGSGDRTRRYALLAAAALCAAVLGYHVLSTGEVLDPVYAAALPTEAKGLLDVLWYDMALLIALGGVGMIAAAYNPRWRVPLAWFVGGHYLALSALCLVFSFRWFGEAWSLIHWAVFAPMSLVTIWAAKS